MDSADHAFRSAFDYLGFLVYATIVGGGLPPQEVLEAAHPRNLRLAQGADRGRPHLRVVVRNDDPLPAPTLDLPDEQIFSAA